MKSHIKHVGISTKQFIIMDIVYLIVSSLNIFWIEFEIQGIRSGNLLVLGDYKALFWIVFTFALLIVGARCLFCIAKALLVMPKYSKYGYRLKCRQLKVAQGKKDGLVLSFNWIVLLMLLMVMELGKIYYLWAALAILVIAIYLLYYFYRYY